MDAAFTPAAFLHDSIEFGRALNPAWTPAQPGQEGDRYAALIQHRLALEVRRHAGARNPAEFLLDELLDGESRKPYVTRKLNGQLPLTFLELATWMTILDADPLAIFERRDL